MKIIDCEQGSPEWFAARAGRATASEFSSILAKGQGKTRAAYLRRVAAERLTSKIVETYSNAAMERGKELEPFARAEYEMIKGVLVDQVGLILPDDDNILASCSPDGLIGMSGGLEIKCVNQMVQLDTILAGAYPSEHKAQIQGNIWITDRKWWDFVSFCPEMPKHLQTYIFRVFRDEAYIENLCYEVMVFLADVKAMLAKLPAAPLPPGSKNFMRHDA
jgi:hypothetical protein